MSTKEEILALFIDDTEQRRLKIQSFIQDSANSYEDRKAVWESTPKHLHTNDRWLLHLRKFEEKHWKIAWIGDYGYNRYQVVDLTELVDEENWEEDEIKDFITECMDKGIHGFMLDW